MSALFCPTCKAPVAVDESGRVGKHKEQIVTAYGWGDGYSSCIGKGRPPYVVAQPYSPRCRTTTDARLDNTKENHEQRAL